MLGLLKGFCFVFIRIRLVVFFSFYLYFLFVEFNQKVLVWEYGRYFLQVFSLGDVKLSIQDQYGVEVNRKLIIVLDNYVNMFIFR